MRPVDFRPHLTPSGEWWRFAPLTPEAKAFQPDNLLFPDSCLEARINQLLDHGFRVELDLSNVSEEARQ